MYDKYFLPYLLNYICGQKPFFKQRQKIVPMAYGKVLEVGIGSGLNMPLLNTDKISSLTGIDPSEELIQLAEKRIDDSMPTLEPMHSATCFTPIIKVYGTGPVA